MSKARLLAVTCAALLLAGCSGGGAADTDVNLRMTVWTADKSQLALFNGIADDYRKSHPDIKSIAFDVIPVDGYTTALTTQVASSSPPDLAWVLERDAPDFVDSGALADLTPTFKAANGYDLGELTPTSTKLWQKGGDLYAYPFSTSPFGMFYNKDLLAQAGVTQDPSQLLAAGQWTWQHAEQMAAQVAARVSGKSGLVLRDWEYKMWTVLGTLWGGFGANGWSADGKTCEFASPQMVAAMTFLHNAIFTDKALPGPGTTADFFAGDSGLTVTQISRASLLKSKPFAWGIVPLPAGPAGDAQVFGQAGIGVLAKGKHAQQAADFLAFFSDKANSAKLAQYFPPARDSLVNAADLAKVNPLFTPEQLQQVVVDGIRNGTVLAPHTNSAKLQTLVQAALDPLWKADANVGSVLAGVCKAIDPVLSQ